MELCNRKDNELKASNASRDLISIFFYVYKKKQLRKPCTWNFDKQEKLFVQKCIVKLCGLGE